MVVPPKPVVAAFGAASLLSLAVAAPRQNPPCVTAERGGPVRISVGDVSQQTFTCESGCKNNSHPAISADGSKVAFESDAWDVVAAAPNPRNTSQVYVRDLALGTTTLISARGAGGPPSAGNGDSTFPDFSGDGRFVAFSSRATNLDPLDVTPASDVYLCELATGSLRRLTQLPNGADLNGPSAGVDIDATGRYVAFWSQATNLAPLAAGQCTPRPAPPSMQTNVYVLDTLTGVYDWISIGDGCTVPDASTKQIALSDTGLFAAFATVASNIVPGDHNGLVDIFLRDRVQGVTRAVSVSSSGVLGNGPCGKPALSGDGRFIAFESQAWNLVGGDTNGFSDVFVHDRILGVTVRISVDSSGKEANGHSVYPALSDDGRFVAFSSYANNLDASVPPAPFLEFFLHDRDADGNGIYDEPGGICTRMIARGPDQRPNGLSGGNADLSADGSHIVFMSHASNLLSGDTNGIPTAGTWETSSTTELFGRDVFLYVR